jgi:hypothetical protein
MTLPSLPAQSAKRSVKNPTFAADVDDQRSGWDECPQSIDRARFKIALVDRIQHKEGSMKSRQAMNAKPAGTSKKLDRGISYEVLRQRIRHHYECDAKSAPHQDKIT